MKKKILIGTFSILASVCLQAQNKLIEPNKHAETKAHNIRFETDRVDRPNLDFSQSNRETNLSTPKIYANGISEQIIGQTYYDLQTNNSIQNRLLVHSDQSISTVWTMNPTNDQDAQYPNRGTGYNYFDGNSWLPKPLSRIESKKTGWPSVAALDNMPVVSAHSNLEEKVTWTSKVTRSEDRWSEAKSVYKIGSNKSLKQMWPRIKVGGPDGKSIHLISHTYDSNIDSNLVAYSRSLDGGETWDIVDTIFPEIGRDFFLNLDADAYAMDVRGETVAFVIGDKWTDIVLMKSNDNGSTWTKTIIRDHPITIFNDDVIIDETTNPDSNGRIDNTDGSFSISLDANNNAHVFFGLMSYSNKSINDDIWEYYPLSDGIMYWNEEKMSLNKIVSIIDLNQDNRLNIDSSLYIANYGIRSLTSFPTSTIANNGDLYLGYSSVMESLYSDQIEAGNNGNENYLQHYRHPYLIKSEDNGNSWSDPMDLMEEITNPITGDPLQEGVFGCLGNVVDDFIHFTYQRDQLPGMNISGDKDPVTKNDIVYLKIPVTVFSLTSEEVQRESAEFQLFPNPSSETINIQLNKNDAGAVVKVINILGEAVAIKNITGYKTQMNIESLKPGIYSVSIETETKKMVKNLLIQ